MFGLATVPVRAEATAKSELMGSAKYVAPIAVNIQHPMLTGMEGGVHCPCFDTADDASTRQDRGAGRIRA